MRRLCQALLRSSRPSTQTSWRSTDLRDTAMGTHPAVTTATSTECTCNGHCQEVTQHVWLCAGRSCNSRGLCPPATDTHPVTTATIALGLLWGCGLFGIHSLVYGCVVLLSNREQRTHTQQQRVQLLRVVAAARVAAAYAALRMLAGVTSGLCLVVGCALGQGGGRKLLLCKVAPSNFERMFYCVAYHTQLP